MRDIQNLKMGLVLAGGGGKGAYEAGVIAALWDLGLVKNITAVSGSSIGTVNTLLFCMEDRKLIDTSWRSLNYAQIITLNEALKFSNISMLFKSWLANRKDIKLDIENEEYTTGLISERGIREFIEKYIDMKKLKNTSIDLYGCAFNLKKQAPVYFHLNDYNEEEIVDICIASCAIPDVLSPITIDGEPYVDGGYHSIFSLEYKVDNVPIKPLKDHDCEMIVVVHLDYLDKVDHRHYPHHAIVEIFPSIPLEIANGLGTVNIFKDSIQKRIDLGYRDALVSLAPILMAYTRGDCLKSYLAKNHKKNLELVKNHQPLPLEFLRFVQENILTREKKGE